MEALLLPHPTPFSKPTVCWICGRREGIIFAVGNLFVSSSSPNVLIYVVKNGRWKIMCVCVCTCVCPTSLATLICFSLCPLIDFPRIVIAWYIHWFKWSFQRKLFSCIYLFQTEGVHIIEEIGLLFITYPCPSIPAPSHHCMLL